MPGAHAELMLIRRALLPLSTLLIAVALFLATPSCQHVPTPVKTGVSDVVQCSKAAVQDTALHILDDVASALATGDWQGGLLDLVKRFGGDAVSCVLDKIRGDAIKYATTTGSPDQLEMLKAARANQWLTANHVVFAGAGRGRAMSVGAGLAALIVAAGHDARERPWWTAVQRLVRSSAPIAAQAPAHRPTHAGPAMMLALARLVAGERVTKADWESFHRFRSDAVRGRRRPGSRRRSPFSVLSSLGRMAKLQFRGGNVFGYSGFRGFVALAALIVIGYLDVGPVFQWDANQRRAS
jgi:hypothetical protein